MFFKGKIVEKLRKAIGDYLFEFDEKQLNMSLLSGTINLNNVNIKPDKLNEDF